MGSSERGDQHRRRIVCARVPHCRAVPDEYELCAIGHGVSRRGLLGPDLAGVIAAEPLRVGAVHHRETEGGVEPAVAITDVLWVDREARG